MLIKIPALVLLCLTLVNCSTNPVTGEKELRLVSENQEIDIGVDNYFPTQQSQGGVYILDPNLDTYVKSIGSKLAAVSDRPKLPYDFVVLNNSVPNAWALPGGKIAVNRGLLLELENEAELAAVLGHEIVHAAARHGAKSMERGLLLGASVAALGMVTGDGKSAALIVGAAGLGSQLINKKYGRDAELESDLFGMKYMAKAGYNPIAAVTLQEKFVKLSQQKQAHWLEGLFSSHPPSPERVQTNKQTAISLSSKGQLNTKNFKHHIAHLSKTKPAYDAYDNGRQKLNEGKHQTALDLSLKALSIEPQESLFHSLKGDALAKLGKLKQAENSYTKAINYNTKHFLYFLQRGIVREKLNNDAGAKFDLEQSLKFLPTTTAHYSLGNIALRSGDTNKAKKHFALASNDNSAIGKQAAQEYARLELPSNPNKYLNTHFHLDKYNKLYINVQNTSPIAIKEISFAISVALTSTQVDQQNLTFNQTIQPGTKQTIITPITTIPGKTTLKDITVRIVNIETDSK